MLQGLDTCHLLAVPLGYFLLYAVLLGGSAAKSETGGTKASLLPSMPRGRNLKEMCPNIIALSGL